MKPEWSAIEQNLFVCIRYQFYFYYCKVKNLSERSLSVVIQYFLLGVVLSLTNSNIEIWHVVKLRQYCLH